MLLQETNCVAHLWTIQLISWQQSPALVSNKGFNGKKRLPRGVINCLDGWSPAIPNCVVLINQDNPTSRRHSEGRLSYFTKQQQEENNLWQKHTKARKKSNLPEILVDWLMPLFSMLSRIGSCLGLKIFFSDQWDCWIWWSEFSFLCSLEWTNSYYLQTGRRLLAYYLCTLLAYGWINSGAETNADKI